jgi:hypothetical protein
VGEGTESARAQVLAARALLDEELVRLEASARAAVDIKAKVKRNPVKAAGAAAGVGFMLVGGPKKALRGARNRVFGRPEPLPASMLPEDVDTALRALGDDGGRVRGAIERDFARYLEERKPERDARDLRGTMSKLLQSFGSPILFRYGMKVADQLLGTDNAAFADRLAKVRSSRGELLRRPKLPF